MLVKFPTAYGGQRREMRVELLREKLSRFVLKKTMSTLSFNPLIRRIKNGKKRQPEKLQLWAEGEHLKMERKYRLRSWKQTSIKMRGDPASWCWRLHLICL